MDLLIHAVIWLLKQLFGDNEKPAEMDRPSRPTTQSRPRSSSGGAPSLEELLAEVRREAERKQQGGQGQYQPPQQQAPVRRAPVPQQEPEPPRTPRHVTVESAPERMPPPPVQLPKLAPVMTVDAARDAATGPSAPMQSTKPQPKKQGKQQKQKQRRPQMEVQTDAAIGTAYDSKIAIHNLLQTVRNGTDADRQMLTQQAFILKEIFGPCRAHNAYKAPMGSFKKS